MPYRIEYEPEVLDELKHARGYYRGAARRRISALAADPRPGDAEPLRDLPNAFKVRLKDWRLVWRVDDEERVVYILRAGLKEGPEFYEDLPNC